MPAIGLRGVRKEFAGGVVAAVVLVVVSVVPVYLANRLSGDAAGAVTT